MRDHKVEGAKEPFFAASMLAAIKRGQPWDLLPSSIELRERLAGWAAKGISNLTLTEALVARLEIWLREMQEKRARLFLEALYSRLLATMESLAACETPPLRAALAHQLIDKATEESDQTLAREAHSQPSCRRGCANCCYLRVAASNAEVDLIHEFMSRHKIRIDRERLAAQRRAYERIELKEPQTWKERACVFLDEDDSCRIYPVRPANCRKHAVISDPRLCHPQEAALTSTLVRLEAEIVAAALFNLEGSQEGGRERAPSLPDLLGDRL